MRTIKFFIDGYQCFRPVALVASGNFFLFNDQSFYMQTILAPTDFSPSSMNAVKYAADFAVRTGYTLTLFHVYPIPVTYGDATAVDYTLTELSDYAEQKMLELREKMVDYSGGRLIIHTTLKEGDVHSELIQYCEEITPYAVVMGTETTGRIERLLYGGSSLNGIDHLVCPVIVVPPEKKFTGFRKIGLACDFKDVPETIPTDLIKELLIQFKAELHILHSNPSGVERFSDEILEGSELLHSVIAGFKPKYHFIKNRNTERSVVECAEKNNIDLLIIIPKKHNLVHKIFHRSHSKKLVLYTHVPILSVHEY